MSVRLDHDQTEALRSKLVAQQRELLVKAREGLEMTMNRELDSGRDSIDESNDEELLSTELRLRDREKWLLGKIRDALTRLDDETINECEDCGEEIGFRRLLVRPVTTLCIACKEDHEEQEAANRQGGE